MRDYKIRYTFNDNRSPHRVSVGRSWYSAVIEYERSLRILHLYPSENVEKIELKRGNMVLMMQRFENGKPL